MNSELIINSSKRGDRIALLEDKILSEYHFESSEIQYKVGDIFLGTVRRTMPGLNAAFVDVGHEKDGFLHFHDLGLNFRTFNKFVTQSLSDKTTSASLSSIKFEPELEKLGKISTYIKPGQRVLVQVEKEPISSKGPRLSSDISLAGRYVVLVPFSTTVSVSRKIGERAEKERLKQVINSIKPKNFGVIVRTVAQNKSLEELEKDLTSLVKNWQEGIKKLKIANSKDKIVGEIDRTSSILRDVLNDSFDSIIVDSESLYLDIRKYLSDIAPEKENIVKFHSSKAKVFEAYGIEKQLKSSFGKSISLKGGGYLIIEQTEALMVVDVNSGSQKNSSQENNALAVNLLAVEEMARQLRLRDIGGIIVIDFIDMKNAEDKKMVYDKMKEVMTADRSRHTILPLTKFGLMQITRQRVRPAINIKTSESCPTCDGSGRITASILVSDKIDETIEFLSKKQNEKKISLFVHPFLYSHFTKGLFSKRFKWWQKFGVWITLYKDSSLPITEFKVFNKEGEEIEVI